jgi:hypothetical protein
MGLGDAAESAETGLGAGLCWSSKAVAARLQDAVPTGIHPGRTGSISDPQTQEFFLDFVSCTPFSGALEFYGTYIALFSFFFF